MKKEISEPMYNLVPSQQSMYMLIKYSLHKQVIQIPTSFAVDKKLDFELLQQALNIEIERNDCLRLRFVKGEKGIVKQYFLPEFKYKAEVKMFTSKQEQDAFFDADAQTPVKFFKDECFRVVFFRSPDGGTGIYFNVCHLNMDAMAVAIFYFDLLGVYKSLATGCEMPEPLYNYEDHIKADFDYLGNKAKYDKDEAFFREYLSRNGESFYAGIHGPELLEKARLKSKNPNMRVPPVYDLIHDKANVIEKQISTEDAKKIFDYCLKTKTAPESILQMGFRTHASSINYRTPDVFMLALCSRRVTYKDKHMGGCLTQPMQTRTIMQEDDTFTDALQQYTSVRTQLYRHMNFPYTEALRINREIYNYKATQGPSCMMFTWLPIPLLKDSGIKVDFKGYNLGRYIMPLYVFAYPNPKTNGITLNYMYRTRFLNEDNINKLHENAVKVILEGVTNPDVEVGKLLDCITK